MGRDNKGMQRTQLACLSCKAILWRRFVRAADAQRYAVSPMIVKCDSCGYENEFAQPYPYHAGFGNQGFLYNNAGNLTLVWSLYDSDYEALVGGKDALHFTDEDRATIESSLLPARFGGRFRFANPARCKQCRSEISGSMLRTVSYLGRRWQSCFSIDHRDLDASCA
jgi:hypothetical protein